MLNFSIVRRRRAVIQGWAKAEFINQAGDISGLSGIFLQGCRVHYSQQGGRRDEKLIRVGRCHRRCGARPISRSNKLACTSNPTSTSPSRRQCLRKFFNKQKVIRSLFNITIFHYMYYIQFSFLFL